MRVGVGHILCLNVAMKKLLCIASLLMSLCVAQDKGAHALEMANKALAQNDYQKAIDYLQKAMTSNTLTQSDYKKAIDYLQKAADLGNMEAYGALGYLYSLEVRTPTFHIPKDPQKAIHYYKKVADLGNLKACFNIALLYRETKDYKNALIYLQKATKLPDKDAVAKVYLLLGYMHDVGQGVPRDAQKAMHYYQQAADLGNMMAYYNIAMIYKRAKDYDKALQILKKAAKMGYNAAYYGLGKMYDKGQGVAQDYKQAWHYYQQAAKLGYAQAFFKLGDMLDKGQGAPQDKQKARAYYKKACDKGDRAGAWCWI